MNIKNLAILTDIILAFLGFRISFGFRFPQQTAAVGPLMANFTILPFLSLIYAFSLATLGLYQNKLKSHSLIIQKVFLGCIYGTLAGISFAYLFREKWGTLPSSIFFISFPVIFLFIATVKIMLYRFTGNIAKNVLFVGESELNNLEAISLNPKIDEIVLTVKPSQIEKMLVLIRLAEIKQAKISILPGIYDNILSDKIKNKGTGFILPAYFQNTAEGPIIRAVDIVIASLLLFFTLPIIALVAFIIKIDSFGPAIYEQKRVGLNGKRFILYKFRSMIVGAAQFSRPKEVSLEQDERVTKRGRVLRKTRLDELPQLFNVLKGNMSLVGPRPEAEYRVMEHRALQGIRLSVRPGLTGLAQIESYYHTIPRHKLKYDYLYIKNRTLLLNLNILFRSAVVILSKSGS